MEREKRYFDLTVNSSIRALFFNITMDLKHSNVPEVTVVADAYMPGSKSSDLIKPPINGSSATLDTPTLPPGIYWITFQNKKVNKIKKNIKENDNETKTI